MKQADMVKWFEWLDEIRAGGSCNVMGIRPLLAAQFGLDRKLSAKVHVAWMNSFNPMEPVAKRAAWAIEQEKKSHAETTDTY